MKKIISIIIICAAFTAYGQTPVAGPMVSGTWTLGGSPYNVNASIMVPADSTLIIEAGVTVNFQGHFKLLVLGRLLATGTVADSIIFTAANTTTGWYGLRFDNTNAASDTSKLSYCKLQWGKANGVGDNAYGGAVYFNKFSKVIISNCLISNNSASDYGGAIYADSSNPRIIYNSIINNTASTGGGILCEYSGALISHNTISGNTATYCGGIRCHYSSGLIISYNTISYNSGCGIDCRSCSPSIVHNSITNNSSSEGSGIKCLGSNPGVNYNIISNNTGNWGGAIYCDYSSSPTFSNNIICNNTATSNGGGIYCYTTSNPTFMNNTIVNNNADKGGALYCSGGSNPVFRNTILYGNTANTGGAQVYLSDEPSDPGFYYCDVQGGSAAFDLNGNFYFGAYNNNIDTNPVFVTPSAGSGTGYNGAAANWALQSTSLCIDAGSPSGTYPPTDFAGNQRVVGSYIDIGAFEYQGTIGTADYELQNKIIIYPNPFRDFTTIQIQTRDDFTEISLYDVYGQIIKTINSIPGDKIEVFRDNLPGGIYFIRLTQSNKIIATSKIIITD